jgi:RNA polymerase sigma factor (sigma-70 family)
MYIFRYFIIYLFLSIVWSSTTKYTTYLTPTQSGLISTILQHNSTTFEMKQCIQKILVKKYYGHAFYLTKLFCENNPNLVRNIQRRELLQYAMIGLLHAARKYNGKSDFSKYLKIYITYSLYRGVTECNSICLIPHRLRVNKPWKLNNSRYYYCAIKGPIRSLDDKYFIYEEDNNNHYNENERVLIKNKVISIIDELDTFSKRMFYLRYDKDTFKKIRLVKTVAQLSCCSEEYVRIKLNNVYKKIYIKFKI